MGGKEKGPIVGNPPSLGREAPQSPPSSALSSANEDLTRCKHPSSLLDLVTQLALRTLVK